MARNRKRAKERRARQPQPVGSGRSRVDGLSLLGSAELGDQRPDHLGNGLGDGAPDPIEQAAPDAEVAQERLAIAGSVEAADAPLPEGNFRDVEEADVPLEDEDVGGVEAPPPAGPPDSPPVDGSSAGLPAPAQHAAVAVPRPWLGARLVAFLEGSWRELQRVQWPDRRQVMQATGVVVGFVIVASVFLGVADFLAGKIVHFVLNGNF